MTSSGPSKAKAAVPNLAPYLSEYKRLKHELSLFMGTVSNWFSTHPELALCRPPAIHSVKSRLKDEKHLEEKIKRKYVTQGVVQFSPTDLGSVVTDLSGVRVIHLHQKQLATIHKLLTAKVESDWHLVETKAFTWDPESATYFRSLGLTPEVRDTFYTSVHYTVRPRHDSPLICEIQVRTLFEEIWGK